MGDILFNLANFSTKHELPADQTGRVSEYYFGEAPDRQVAQLNIVTIKTLFCEAVQDAIRIGISNLDGAFACLITSFTFTCSAQQVTTLGSNYEGDKKHG